MATLSKIAKLAHVSVSTVSKAFSMSKEVSDETRELIFNIAKENGCFKKYYKAKYPKFVVAVICPEFESRYYAIHISLIEKYLAECDCDICVASTCFSRQKEHELISYYSEYASVDAIIVIGNKHKDYDTDIPILYTENEHREASRNGLEHAITYFLNRGVSKIGFIGETHTVTKYDDFNNLLLENGISSDDKYISITEERFEKGGYIAMQKLFDNGNVPRAVICAYDYMAIGAIRCVFDNGLRVPDDVAVVGFDDIPESEFLNPPLASIATGTDALCKNITEKLICILTGKKYTARALSCSEFHLRHSADII